MSWVRTNSTHAVKLLPQIAKLYRGLTELKVHQMTVRAGLQAQMLAAEKNRDTGREKK